jgi:hypothetical protein
MRRAVALSILAVLAACNLHSVVPSEPPAARAAAEPPTPAQIATQAATPAPMRSPSTLAALLAEYDALVASGGDSSKVAELRDAIDHAAAQRDATTARLYWYTDLDEAKAEAKRTGKPILSLRLLGRLDEELSCANSRLFRLALYANEHVSQFLRDTYVLHWSAERPAPKVTLDLGDGRVVTRTITGNSAHYVLDTQGRVVDVLPGLFGPAQFERTLRSSLDLARRSGELDDEEMQKAVSKYHARELWLSTLAWRKALKHAYVGYESYVENASLPTGVTVAWPHPLYSSLPAAVVNDLTVSKADMEAPQLALFQPEIGVYEPWGAWAKLTRSIAVEHLDAQSRALIESKHPRDWSSGAAPELDPAKLAKSLAAFERRMTDDGTRNEFVYHSAIHARLAGRAPPVDFESVNEFVYTRVFRTAKSDAWLGLMPTEAVTGIDRDGLVSAAP